MVKKKSEPKKVDSIRHKDKRKNIPTEELRDFVTDDASYIKTLVYPRDPSLDPQLVWKGKDEQDLDDLVVPVVPIYIQEKIHPQAIINALPRIGQQSDNQINFFADFNDGPTEFEQKIDFYSHEQNWSNRLVLGDSLLVMNSLAEKEGLKGKVQTIYLDPPYGIKFGSNWQVSTRKTAVKDGKAEDVTRQPEQVRAFRDTWQLGIHSYLAYLRDRLIVARDLLTETGSIFVQIGDENIHLVRCVMDEVFGSENFISLITFRKKNMPFGARYLEGMVDYLLWYGKNSEHTKYNAIFRAKDVQGASRWNLVQLPDNTSRTMTSAEWQNHKLLPPGSRVYTQVSLRPSGYSEKQIFDVQFNGTTYHPPVGGCWTTTQDGMKRLILAGRIGVENTNLRYRLFLDDYPVERLTNFWTDTSGAGEKVYVVQTMDKVIERCLLMTTSPGDLILDPTCGSGTTAYVAEKWGRRWITCDTSRVSLALTRTRLMAAKYSYYLLMDSPEGIQKEQELIGEVSSVNSKTQNDINKGFIYKRVSHITLGSIANNLDITEGMTQEQISAAISRNTDFEFLYDQPYEDKKRVRVCGPFTVESLSPHRVLSIADENMDGTVTEQEARKQQDFATMILDNLKKAGVQNTYKNERLKFDRLDPYAGTWLHAAGNYLDTSGNSCRVAVSIGPEHGTVGPQQVKEAAKEAVKGIGFDLLIICGFAFDSHVAEEAKRYGKLTVLPTKMNPDLAMSDDLLKKTGAGNLFMVFGEPDVEIAKQIDGKMIVEIKGVDVYDPTTGQIRSSSTDDIACWFIDTDYNGESFFVRHAYFTGADEPYEKLKKTLRADIDEAIWSSLYSTVSRAFDIPELGKIAIKVINHYGDEVLKVFDVK